MKIILAPHLDDEVIGCYSILHQVDLIYFFAWDYRAKTVEDHPRYKYTGDPDPSMKVDGEFYIPKRESLDIGDDDEVYIPSRFDLHPMHHLVNRFGLGLSGKHFFYSVEMNVPWLELEDNPEGKKAEFCEKYPGEVDTILKNDKYFLFKSIKSFDDIIWASARFERVFLHKWPDAPLRVGYLRSTHRHKLYIQVDVQQFGDDRDIEYLTMSETAQELFDKYEFPMSTSCEMVAIYLKSRFEMMYVDRLVRVSVYEDGENGCVVGGM